jgi:hypothetical protein
VRKNQADGGGDNKHLRTGHDLHLSLSAKGNAGAAKRGMEAQDHIRVTDTQSLAKNGALHLIGIGGSFPNNDFSYRGLSDGPPPDDNARRRNRARQARTVRSYYLNNYFLY